MRGYEEPLPALLQQAARGERDAFDRVFARLYPDLGRSPTLAYASRAE